MELATEMVIKAAEAKLATTEIPIVLHRDGRDRPPHLRPFRDGWRNLRFMLMMAPNWLFLLPGALSVAIGAGLLIALWGGPMRLGPLTLDLHAMLSGMALALVGVFLILTGIFTKVFAHTERIGLHDSAFTRLLSKVELEHGLIVSGLLILSGLIGNLWLLHLWAGEGTRMLGPQYGFRASIIFTTSLLVGIELFFASFFISILGLSRDCYTGKY